MCLCLTYIEIFFINKIDVCDGNPHDRADKFSFDASLRPDVYSPLDPDPFTGEEMLYRVYSDSVLMYKFYFSPLYLPVSEILNINVSVKMPPTLVLEGDIICSKSCDFYAHCDALNQQLLLMKELSNTYLVFDS